MNNRKKFFSYGLFKEGLRQTRASGLIGLITVLAITLFSWMGCLGSYELEELLPGETLLYGSETVGMLLIQFCLVSPFLVLGLFQFLNKRDSSDAYHSMPHSRECLHISYFAGVTTWNFITVASAILLAVALYGFTPSTSLKLSEIFSFGFNMFAASFSVSASVLLAMSVTGTRFTNMVVSLLVIFMPRLLMNSFVGMVNDTAVIVNVEKQFFLFNPSLNVAAGIPLNLFNSFSNDSAFEDCLLNPLNGLYTLGLGLLTLAVALWLLHHRKSETAGKSSPNRRLQAVYRVALGFVLGLIPVAVILSAILEGDIDNFDYLLIILILVFFVALAYFLFEFFTTKKAKNMVKAIPTFFLVLVLNGIFLGSVYWYGNSLLDYTPTADEIESVSIIMENDQNYFAANASKLFLTDAPTKELVSKALQDTANRAKEGRLHSTYGTFYGDYYTESYTTVDVCIQGSRGKQYRTLLMPDDDYTFIVTAMESSAEYKEAFYQVPTPRTHLMTYTVEDTSLTGAQNLGVYNALMEDIDAMPFEQWYPMAASIHSLGGKSAFTLSCTVAHEGNDYYFYYPITKTLTPKAFDLILQYLTEREGNDLAAFRTQLETAIQNQTEYEDYDVSVIILDPIEEYFITGGDWPTAVMNLLDHAKPYTSNTEDVVVELQLNQYTSYTLGEETSVYFTVEREYIETNLNQSFTVYD